MQKMVNREKRLEASGLIRKLATGELTNDDFEDSFPREGDDPALAEIYQRLWFFWSDRFTHRLTGPHQLSEDNFRLCERCVLFLGTDLEYEWPRAMAEAPLSLVFYRLLRMKRHQERIERKALNELERLGDLDVWPFIRRSDYEDALAGNSS